jgi:hypothetical protein
MFKNMSFGKILTIFIVFLLLMLAAAFFISKTILKQKTTNKPVITKTYRAHEQPAPARALPEKTSDPFGNMTNTVAALGGLAGAGNIVAPASSQSPQEASPEFKSRLNNIDASLTALNNRLDALERENKAIKKENPAIITEKRPLAHQHIANKRIRKKSRDANELSDYKTMAVVGHRTWIEAPDGAEDSVTKGESAFENHPRVHSH